MWNNFNFFALLFLSSYSFRLVDDTVNKIIEIHAYMQKKAKVIQDEHYFLLFLSPIKTVETPTFFSLYLPFSSLSTFWSLCIIYIFLRKCLHFAWPQREFMSDNNHWSLHLKAYRRSENSSACVSQLWWHLTVSCCDNHIHATCFYRTVRIEYGGSSIMS